MTSQIARDMERKISADLEAFLNRELALARHVLDGHELVIIILMLAVSMSSTAAATVAADAKPGVDKGDLFDVTLSMILDRAREMKPIALARMAEVA